MENDCVLKNEKLFSKKHIISCATCSYYETSLCLKDRDTLKKEDKHDKMRRDQE